MTIRMLRGVLVFLLGIGLLGAMASNTEAQVISELPHYEDFSDQADPEAPVFPEGWETVGNVGLSTWSDKIAGFSMRFPSPTENPMAITPEIHSDLDFSELRLRFDAHFATAGDIGDSVHVGFISDPADPATFTLIESFGLERDAINFMVDLSVHEEGDGRRIAFMAERGGAWNSHYYGNVLLENVNDPLEIGPFALLSPPDATELLVAGDPGVEVVISWEEAELNVDADVIYTWHLDLRGGDFSDPIISIPSDSAGIEPQLTLTVGAVDGVLEANNLNVGDILEADWTVTAEFYGEVGFADAAFAIDLERGVVDIPILPPPDDDRLSLQPFPFVFNMDTEVVDWFEPTFFPFEGAVLHRISNPDPSGLNETDFVLKYEKGDGGQPWAGFFYRLDNPVKLTDESVFKMKIWSPRADIQAIMKLELVAGGGMPDQLAEVTQSGEWIELEWDLSGLDRDTPWDMATIILDLDTDNPPQGGELHTWYVDDFRLEGVEVFPVPLAGEYFIPQGGHARGFETLSEALSVLNTLGATDHVTLYIDDDLDETENTLLISREDLTEETSVLIKPAPGKTPTITVAHGTGGDRTGNTGFSIERAKYVTIDGSNTVGGDTRDLTILFAEEASTGSIMTIYSTVNHITVKNTILTHIHGEMNQGVLIDRSAGQDSLVQNVTLHNVSIGEADQVVTTAVFLRGVFGSGADPAQAELMDNITITDSHIFGTRWSIYVQSASNLEFTGNNFVINGYSATSTQSQRAAVQLQLAKDANISNNNITFGDINYQTDAAGVGGIYLNRNHGPILISNNFINFSELVNTGSGTEYVITGIGSHVAGFAGLDPEYHIYHNTILLDSPAEEVGRQVAIGPIVSVVSGRFDIRNNIVINRKDAANAYAIQNFLAESPNATASFMSDFNNLYVTGDANIGFWGEARADLAAWRDASGQDMSSSSVAVEFVADDDLRLAGESLGDFSLAGTPLDAVTTDFFGTARNESYPYKGAHEGDVEMVPDRITIVEPPDGQRMSLQPFPFAFNMDTEDVSWFEPTFFPFSGAQLARIENPDASGLNESDFVLEYTKPEGSDAWAGFFYRLDNPVQITDDSEFRLKVWAPKADFNATMKLELVAGGGMPDQIAEVTQAGEWVEVVWDLSGVDRETPWDMVTVIMDLDQNPVPTTETWYLDDFRLEGVEIGVAPLAGNYFIPQGDHDRGFADLAEAIAELNERGTFDPVTWYITDDLDHSDAELPIIQRDDLSEDTPLTIKPAPDTDVTVSFTGSYGIAIDNTSWVTIDGYNDGSQMTFLMAQEDGAGTGLVRITEDAQHIAVRNLNLQHEYGGGQAIRLRQAIAGAGSVSPNGVLIENNTIGTHENTFADGVVIWGSAVIPVQNVEVVDNLIYAGRRGITTFFIEENTYRGNEMYVTGQVASDTWHGAIYLAGGVGEINIYENRILEVAVNGAGYAGAMLLNASGDAVNIYNNFIAMNVPNMGDSEANNIYGIVINHPNPGEPLNIWHNSILLPETGLTGGIHAGLGWERDEIDITDHVNFVNNIVINENDLDVAYGFEWPWDTGIGMSDFNNIYVPNGNAGFWNDAAAADLAAWQDATGQDENSVTAAVEFESNTDLTLVGASVGDNRLAGTPVEMVTTDIFGNERSEEYPYMGAFEGDIELEREPTDVEVDQPYAFSLDQNYPNPFNPATNIQFTLPETMEVRLDVYDVTGRHVMTLVNGQREAGVHTVVFDGAQLASGVYVYRIIAGPHIETRKMTFIK